MVLKCKTKKSSTIPVSDYVKEYVTLRNERTWIDKRMKEVAEALKQYAQEKGQKDDKGSYYFERAGYTIGKQARKRITFDVEKSTEFFRRRGYPECIKVTESIDEEAVEELLNAGEITVEDLEEITTTDVKYSIDIKPVEEVTDVAETSTVKRSKK